MAGKGTKLISLIKQLVLYPYLVFPAYYRMNYEKSKEDVKKVSHKKGI